MTRTAVVVGLLLLGCAVAPLAGQNPVADAARKVPLQVGRADTPLVFGFRDGVRQVLLQAVGERVTSAMIDGTPLPSERLVQRERRWFVLDETGGVVADLVLGNGHGRLRTHTDRSRTTLGVTVRGPESEKILLYDLDPRRTLELVAVREGGPAARAGMRVGDVLVEVAGNPSATRATLRDAIAACPPGKAIPVTVLRAGQRQPFALEVEPDYGFYSKEDEPSESGDGPQLAAAAGAIEGNGTLLRTVGNEVVLVPPSSDEADAKLAQIEMRMSRLERLLELLVRRSAPSPDSVRKGK